MNLHEYQSKALFAQYGLPVSDGYAVDTAEEAVEAAKKIGGSEWVIKVQVHAGGRGKAGGVRLVSSLEEVRAFAEEGVGGQQRDTVVDIAVAPAAVRPGHPMDATGPGWVRAQS